MWDPHQTLDLKIKNLVFTLKILSKIGWNVFGMTRYNNRLLHVDWWNKMWGVFGTSEPFRFCLGTQESPPNKYYVSFLIAKTKGNDSPFCIMWVNWLQSSFTQILVLISRTFLMDLQRIKCKDKNGLYLSCSLSKKVLNFSHNLFI